MAIYFAKDYEIAESRTLTEVPEFTSVDFLIINGNLNAVRKTYQTSLKL